MRDQTKIRDWHIFIEERASDYLDDQLSALERAQFERHVSGCQRCQQTVATYQWTLSLLKQAPAPALPRQFTLPVPKAAARAPLFGVNMLRLATAVAMLILVSLLGVDLISQFGGASAPQALPAAQSAQGLRPTIVALVPAPTATPLSANIPTAARAAATTEPAAGAAAVPTQPALPVAPPAPVQATSAPMVAPAAIPPTGPAATSAPRALTQPSASGGTASPTRDPGPGVGFGAGAPETPTPRVSADTMETGRAATTAQPKAQSAGSVTATPSHTPLPTRAVTPSPAPTATPAPPTMALPAATATANVQAPSPTATLRPQVFAQPTSPPKVPTVTPQVPAPAVTPLRIVELGALFATAFLGTLTLLLWRRRR